MPGALAGRGAVVTGGSRGIGAAVAGALADAGAAVMVAGRNAEALESVVARLRARGALAFACPCDVTQEAEVRHLAQCAVADLVSVDILVNNAGAGDSAPLRRITLEDWNRMLAVNATSAFLCTREFLPGMVERGWGRVVNVASRAGIEGARYVAHYSAAKHALIGLTRSVALEVEGRGVTVNAVCPAYVDTPMTTETIANVEARTGKTRDQALAAVLATTGQARLLTADEVAAAVVALCEPAGASKNGQVVLVPAEDR